MEGFIRPVLLAAAPAAAVPAAAAPAAAAAAPAAFALRSPSRSGSPLPPGAGSPRANELNLATLPTWEIRTEEYKLLLATDYFKKIKEETTTFLSTKKESAAPPLFANAGKQ
jgi:hypothetical protein